MRRNQTKVFYLGTAALASSLFVFSGIKLAKADAGTVVDVAQVRTTLKKSGARWTARESWVTRLSRDEARRLMGVRELPMGELDFSPASGAKSRLPEALDWRSKDGANWLGPVMNQGNCGSCVAFATIATLEAQDTITSGFVGLRPTFSPQELFACGGGSCESGWQPLLAALHIKTSGVVDNACLPYSSGSTGKDVECNAKCSDASSRTARIKGFNVPTLIGGSVEAVKTALQKGPLVTTMMVYADFLTYAGGVYQHTSGEQLGGHAVSLVGYDSIKSAWLIRNSWGEEWGEKGFAWVSWDDSSGVGSQTTAYTFTPSGSYLTVATPGERQYVSGKFEFRTQGQGLSRSDIRIHLLDGAGHEATSVGCNGASGVDVNECVSAVDTTSLKEGRYEIYADGAGVKSQVREFYVINSVPRLGLTLKPASGTDLTQPIKDRPEFVISAEMLPVPMQRLEFRVYDQAGKIVSIKSNDFVLSEMQVGWRSNTVPNGKYRVAVHGETDYLGKTYSVESNSFDVTVAN